MRSFFLLIAGVALIVFGAWWFWWRSITPTLEIAGTKVKVEIAITDKEKALGLSNRESLDKGHGMLFVYKKPEYSGIWMKEMRFNIDIIWLAEDGRVVDTQIDVSPDTYPQVYYPTEPSLYVLEVPAGFVYEHNIEPGMKAQLPPP